MLPRQQVVAAADSGIATRRHHPRGVHDIEAFGPDVEVRGREDALEVGDLLDPRVTGNDRQFVIVDGGERHRRITTEDHAFMRPRIFVVYVVKKIPNVELVEQAGDEVEAGFAELHAIGDYWPIGAELADLQIAIRDGRREGAEDVLQDLHDSLLFVDAPDGFVRKQREAGDQLRLVDVEVVGRVRFPDLPVLFPDRLGGAQLLERSDHPVAVSPILGLAAHADGGRRIDHRARVEVGQLERAENRQVEGVGHRDALQALHGAEQERRRGLVVELGAELGGDA